MKKSLVKGLQATTVSIATLPLIALLHGTLTLSIASLLGGIKEAELLTLPLRTLLKSPVHTQLVVETVGGIKPHGMAVPGVPGSMLRRAFAGLFLDPKFATSGAWVSAVLGEDSTVLSLFLTLVSVEVVLIVVGAMLIRAGLRCRTGQAWSTPSDARHLAAVLVGLYIEARAIWTLLLLPYTPRFRNLEDLGIGFALSLLLRIESESYRWLMVDLLPLGIPLISIGLGFLSAWLLTRLFDRILRRQTGRLLSQEPSGHQSTIRLHGLLLIAALPLVGLVSQSGCAFKLSEASLIGLPARHTESASVRLATAVPSAQTDSAAAENSVPADMPENQPSVVLTVLPEQTPESQPAVVSTPTPDPMTRFSPVPPDPSRRLTPTAPVRAPITQVRIHPTERGRLLLVQDQPVLLTGMNYNVNYTELPEETKRAYHRRDFRVMKDAGVNAIIGWGVYDEVTLELAAEFGIGVFMPFDLDPQGPYDNEGYRNQKAAEFREYVQRFARFPALWAWNPGGDELLHRMDTEQHRTVDKLQAAADFLVELSALAYTLDPNHVSVIKEPRDWYIPHLHEAIKKVRALSPTADPSSFLVFGMNVYGHPDEVADAIRQAKRNAEDRLGVALLIGEYAPFGLPRQDRAMHYTRIWDDINQLSPNGGFVYVFGPDQPNPRAPNPYDPLRLLVNEFSLLDSDGQPVDDAWQALAERYRRARQLPSLAPPNNDSP